MTKILLDDKLALGADTLSFAIGRNKRSRVLAVAVGYE